MDSPRQSAQPYNSNIQHQDHLGGGDWHSQRQQMPSMPPLLRATSYDSARYPPAREPAPTQLPTSSSNPYFQSYATSHDPSSSSSSSGAGASYALPPANLPSSEPWHQTQQQQQQPAPLLARPRTNSPPTAHSQNHSIAAPQPLRAYQPYLPLPPSASAPASSSAPPLPSPSWSSGGTPSPILNSSHYLKSPITHGGWNPQQHGGGVAHHGLGLSRPQDGSQPAQAMAPLAMDDRWSPQAYLKQHIPYNNHGSVPGDRSAPTTQGEWNRLNPPRLPLSSLAPPSSWQDSLQDSRAPVPWIRSPSTLQPPRVSPGSTPLGGGAHQGAPTRPLTEERRFHEPATPFIGKLHHLLTQTQHAHLIRWSANGEAFIFRAEDPRLSKLFERIWRTGMVKSFVRQLNIYSFDRAPATLASNWAAGSALANQNRPQLSHLLSGYPSPANSIPSPNLPSGGVSPPPVDDGVGPWTGFSHALFKRETTTTGLSAIKPIAVKKRAREMEEEQKALARAVADATGAGGVGMQEHKRMRSVE